MTTKDQIVDWLVNNEAQTLEIIERTNSRLMEAPIYFQEEAKDQWLREIQNLVIDQITSSFGISCECFHEEIEESEFRDYVNHILETKND
jgi:hypothetical protein